MRPFERFASRSVTALAAFGLMAACQPPPDHTAANDIGVATVAIMSAPADVQCILLTATGIRTVSSAFDVLPGQVTQLSIAGLSLGNNAFFASAFPVACWQITPEMAPTWVSDPVTALVLASEPASLTLVMRRNGRATVGVDFQDDVSCPANCELGTGFCSGSLPVRCIADPNGCPLRVAQLPCGPRQVCDSSDGTCRCEDDVRCGGAEGFLCTSSTTFVTCSRDLLGCIFPATESACVPGTTCLQSGPPSFDAPCGNFVPPEGGGTSTGRGGAITTGGDGSGGGTGTTSGRGV
jgi:hypothetical protein